ncbi:hypothetical protein PtrM4_057700 [Pyrenophora tritici-repentis]|uniref:DDE-1 domain-containing protein n=1 Tax=Pyrenophora tritici-repentis TaxID=45151 RepID=A0A834VU33_9PLEO|nr:hypothetical protein PtrM4_057700 [Pyrenophora tritici-repentis]
MDKKDFAIGVLGRSKRIFSRRQYEKKEVRQAHQDGSREWVSLLAAICADGTALPPGLIFASKNSTIQSHWVAEIKAEKHAIHLKQVFDRYTKPKARLKYQVLIVDDHRSYLTHTQTLQPLDVVRFKPLSSNYSSELDDHLQQFQGLSPLSKDDFFNLFWPAWVNTFEENLVTKAVTFVASHNTTPGPHGDLCEGRPRCANCHGPHWASYSNCAAAPWRTAGRVVRPTKKELNAARRAGHLAYLQESIQANASEGSGDEAAPDLPRPTTADEPTEVPTQAPAKRNRTPATSTSEAGSTLGPAKRPTRKTHKTTNLNLRQLSQQSVTRKPDHTSSSSEATDVEMSESSSA